MIKKKIAMILVLSMTMASVTAGCGSTYLFDANHWLENHADEYHLDQKI